MRPIALLLAVVVLGGGCYRSAPLDEVGPTRIEGPVPAPVATATLEAPSPIRSQENLVVSLQQDLTQLGFYSGPVTTEFDAPTSAAVRDFERHFGLPGDGFYDLELAAVVDVARGRAKGASVWALQSMLGALGYYEASFDGLYGDSLEAAVAALQSAAGLDVTGRYSETTADAMLDEFQANQPEVAWVFGPRLELAAPAPPETVVASPRPAIVRVQERLADLGYRPGPADGNLGPATKAAIVAFQKREGLRVDGVVGPQTGIRLEQPIAAGPRYQSPSPRIEIDLSRQIAFVVLPDGTVTTLPVSTGNGERYITESGGIAVAHTPEGAFSVTRVIEGVREAPLGTLYRPLYFHRGWAIHGSGHVPAYPASHGCVRVHRWDQDWLFDRVGVGTAVFVYGGEAAEAVPSEAAPGS
ncbi:MAG: murein L,D-transpeptidase [Acidimicrobiia bacterium]